MLSLSDRNEEPQRILYNRFLFFQISFPLIGGLLFGYNTGVISGALLLLKNDKDYKNYSQEIVSATLVAAAISSMIGGWMVDFFGRKMTLLIASAFLALGGIVMGFSWNVIVLVVGRSVVGFGIGLVSMSCPIYIAEVSPEEIRGRLILVYQSAIAGGQFLAAIINALFYSYNFSKYTWKYMLGFPALIALVLGVGLFFIPESHRWLILRNQISEAKRIIKKEGRVREENIDEYIGDIMHLNEGGFLPLSQRHMRHKNILYQMLFSNTVRKSLFIGCLIQMISQIVGINGVIYYSSSLIKMSGIVKDGEILWYTSLVMFFCFSPLIIGFFLIDRVGRRKLCLGSLMGIILSTFVIAVGFYIMYITSEPAHSNMKDISTCEIKRSCEACVTITKCGFCKVNNISSHCLDIDTNNSSLSKSGWCEKENGTFSPDYCVSKYNSIVIVGIALYLFSFNVGLGAVSWIVTSEIYPPWSRGVNMAMSTTVNWVFNIIVSISFIYLTEYITRYGTFFLFAGISSFSFILMYIWLLETNQRTLEEITHMLDLSIIYMDKQ